MKATITTNTDTKKRKKPVMTDESHDKCYF